MSYDNEPSTSGRNHHATVYYDYNTPKVEKNSYSMKPPVFNGMLPNLPRGRVTSHCKIYNIYDHVKNIFRSHPARFIPKVTTIQEGKDLDTLSLENLICSLKSHEIELLEINQNLIWK